MESIYSYFTANQNEFGFLTDSYIMLPELLNNSESANWIPGAFEGILLRSNVDLKHPFYVNFLVSMKLIKVVNNPTDENIKAFSAKFMKYSAITMVDSVISHASRSIDKEKASIFARKLAKETDRAEILKLAIALLGEYGTLADADMLKLFASHEEFSLFATVALKNILTRNSVPYNDAVLSLCKSLRGWGKIASVMELDFSLEESRDYVIKYGCKNNIALSYLSNICAIKGKLVNFLKSCLEDSKIFDIDAFNGICDIWEGLTDKDHPENDGLIDYPQYAESYDLFKQCANKFGFSEDSRFKEICERVQ